MLVIQKAQFAFLLSQFGKAYVHLIDLLAVGFITHCNLVFAYENFMYACYCDFDGR